MLYNCRANEMALPRVSVLLTSCLRFDNVCYSLFFRCFSCAMIATTRFALMAFVLYTEYLIAHVILQLVVGTGRLLQGVYRRQRDKESARASVQGAHAVAAQAVQGPTLDRLRFVSFVKYCMFDYVRLAKSSAVAKRGQETTNSKHNAYAQISQQTLSDTYTFSRLKQLPPPPTRAIVPRIAIAAQARPRVVVLFFETWVQQLISLVVFPFCF